MVEKSRLYPFVAYFYTKISRLKKHLVQRLLLLFILILVPSIIIFLHSFGDNQFALKTYHQDSIQVSLPCSSLQAPYRVPNDAFRVRQQLNFPTEEINIILSLDRKGWREQMNGLNSIISTHLERTKIDVLVLLPDTAMLTVQVCNISASVY